MTATAPAPRAFDRPTLFGLAALGALVILVHVPGPHATAWGWFDDAGRLLLGDESVGGAAGLSLYVDHPEFQFGPTAAVLVAPFTWFGFALGSWLAIFFGSALGLVAAWCLASAARTLRSDALAALRPPSLIVGAVVLIVVWGDVAVRTAHLDDAVALAATAGAVWALAGRRPGAATLLFALAAATKPWAAVFLPLLLVVPDARRWLRPITAGAIAVGTWLPFLIAAPETLDVRQYGIPNEASSALRVLGVTDPTTPDWVRPAQLVGGLALVAGLVLVGRWPAALMCGVALRLLLDPAANRYYTVGLVLTVLVFEWVERPERLPWLAVASAVLLEASQLGGVPDTLGGWLRVAVIVAVFATAALWRPRCGLDLYPAPVSPPVGAPAGDRTAQ